jgi:hypothetical protein
MFKAKPKKYGTSQIAQTIKLYLWNPLSAFSSFLCRATVAQTAWKNITAMATTPVMACRFNEKPWLITVMSVVPVVSKMNPNQNNA